MYLGGASPLRVLRCVLALCSIAPGGGLKSAPELRRLKYQNGQYGSLRYETNAAPHEERNTRAQVKLHSTTWKIFLAVDDVEVVGYLGS